MEGKTPPAQVAMGESTTHASRVLSNIYSTVGRSIGDIYDRSAIFTEARSAEVNMSAEVVYRGYGPTYRTIYNILYGECTAG